MSAFFFQSPLPKHSEKAFIYEYDGLETHDS